MKLIDADKFLSQIEDQYMEHDITREKYMDLEDRIMQQPIIEERKTGKWIEVDDAYNRIRGRCSVCGWEAHMYEDDVVGMNYCPNCAADMRGGQNG